MVVATRRSLLAALVLVAVGCGTSSAIDDDAGLDSGDLDSNRTHYDGPVSSGPQGGFPWCALDEDAAAAFAQTTVPGGPCVQGMECTVTGLCGFAACACVGGTWQCADQDSGGGTSGLPTGYPEPCGICFARDFACTLPDRCGVICACVFNRWQCAPVDDGGGGDAGTDCTESACPVLSDEGGYIGPDAGCFAVSCSSIDNDPSGRVPGACDCFPRGR